jgi:hypothetical protein
MESELKADGNRRTATRVELYARRYESANVVATGKPQAEGGRGDDAILPADGELQGHGPRAQDDMLAAGGVEEDVFDIGEGGNEQPWAIGRWAIEGYGAKVQRGGPGLGQPDRMTLLGRQLRINESRRVPTSRPRRDGRASG